MIKFTLIQIIKPQLFCIFLRALPSFTFSLLLGIIDDGSNVFVFLLKCMLIENIFVDYTVITRIFLIFHDGNCPELILTSFLKSTNSHAIARVSSFL